MILDLDSTEIDVHNSRGPFTSMDNKSPASKVLDEITYPFPKLNGATVEVS